MRKDNWNNPRIEFWQAIYEKLLEKYRAEGINIFSKGKVKVINEFCLWVGERIRILRKQKNLTQKMLARKLNISQQMISRIESGGENISLLTLKRIADELGVKVSIET
jgi:ribosome-binding protein aMBF1 (putative translation factor)